MKTQTAKKKSARRFDSLQQEVYLNLWRTYDRLRMVEDAFFAGYDLTAQQYNVLRILKASHPETLPTLAVAEKLVSRAPDITRMLDKLEERELVVRERHNENRRVVRVGITEVGMLLLAAMHDPLQECHGQQLGHLSQAQLKQLGELLRVARGPHEPTGEAWS